MAGIPMVFPVQDSSVSRSTTWKVDRMVPGPDFQSKVVPVCTGPWTVASVMSGFQSGQRQMSAITAQTVSGSAAISISPVANTGALASACTGSLLGSAGSAAHDLVQAGMGAVLDGRGRLAELGLADGGLERLRAGVATGVDEAEVNLRRQAAVEAGGQIARLSAQKLPAGLPTREEGIVAVGRDLKGVDEHHPARILSGWRVLGHDLVQPGMGREGHVPAGEVRVAGGRLEGGHRCPLGHIDEPELGVRAETAMQGGRLVAVLGGQKVAGGLPGRDESLVGLGGHLEQVD